MMAASHRFLSRDDAASLAAGRGWGNHFPEDRALNSRRLAAMDTQIDISDRVRESERFCARFWWADFHRGVSRWFWEVAP
jgi:hypothetical protein